MKRIAIFFTVLILLFSGCNDPVFYFISTQVPVPPPIIGGAPTDFVRIGDTLYVASNTTLYYYEEISKYGEKSAREGWKGISLPYGRITYIAENSSTLYLLTQIEGLSRIYSSTSSPPVFSTLISNPDNLWLLSMYSAGSDIFIGARTRDDNEIYSVLRINGGSLSPVSLNAGETNISKGFLRGVAHNGSTYFFCIKDAVDDPPNRGGIFQGSNSSANIISSYGYPFLGIISNGGRVYAVQNNYSSNRAARLFSVTNSELLESTVTLSMPSNGALFVSSAFNDSSKKLLLVGRQDILEYNTNTGFTYGYMEIELTSTGALATDAYFREPGITAPSTLPVGTGHNDRFKTTLGKYPVRYFYEAPNTGKTLFASSQNYGIWSLKDRDQNGSPYWNTEN